MATMVAKGGGAWSRPRTRTRGDEVAIPRDMPLVMRAAEVLTGTRSGATLFALACDADRHGRVALAGRERSLAFEAGIGGQRATHVLWRRLRELEGAGFLEIRDETGEAGSATLLDPHAAIAARRGELGEALWNAIVAAVAEHGDAGARAAIGLRR